MDVLLPVSTTQCQACLMVHARPSGSLHMVISTDTREIKSTANMWLRSAANTTILCYIPCVPLTALPPL